jgi:hypothetical protein
MVDTSLPNAPEEDPEFLLLLAFLLFATGTGASGPSQSNGS